MCAYGIQQSRCAALYTDVARLACQRDYAVALALKLATLEDYPPDARIGGRDGLAYRFLHRALGHTSSIALD